LQASPQAAQQFQARVGAQSGIVSQASVDELHQHFCQAFVARLQLPPVQNAIQAADDGAIVKTALNFQLNKFLQFLERRYH
jgi:hypothetical protein